MVKRKVYAIIGLGMFGRELCRELSGKGAQVIAIDRNPELTERMKDSVTQVVVLDSTDEDGFSSTPFENIDTAIVAIGDNIEASILTTALLKQKNIPYIIARAVSDIHASVLSRVGADRVLNIEVEQGKRIAQELLAPVILERVPISKSISIVELNTPKSFVGKTLVQLDLRRIFHVTLVSIKRSIYTVDRLGNPVQEEVIIFPDPNEAMKNDDILLVVGENVDIDRLSEY